MLARRAATEVVRTLRSQGHQAYFVGGCVRDLLLGRDPADFDVSTDATPEQVMRIFPRTYAVGAQFGVVLVPFRAVIGDAASEEVEELTAEHPKVIEVATFRSDGAYSDGRHPDAVRYTTDPREDVKRRDFTINGLMLDPLEDQRVLDYVGGQQDLERHVIRTIGEPVRRFHEDKLRMMRAVRFAARFEYDIDAETFSAIQRLAPEIRQVSRERQRDELTKMLTEGRARRAFELLDASGLLHEVLPEVERMKGVEQPPQYHPEGDVWVHTMMILGMLQPGVSRTLAWGGLLHDVGKPPTFRVAPDRIRFDNHVEVGTRMAEEIGHRFRMSNDEIEQIMALVANHLRFADVKNMKESTFKRFIRLSKFDEHLELHRMDCLSSHGILDLYYYTREKMADLEPDQVRPRPLITGNDLLAAGYEQGPRFKEILSAVEDAQLEGRLRNREEAMKFVARQFPS
ncbi:MAG TPA: CCA tRNA nucleotidyltransferase [Terriglobales bacterium]|nr:CCA tRNA nucleotidyltransferase [Terriglobales bacterium]